MLIVDTRDGVVMWRNGRPTEQGKERLDVEAGQRKDDKPGKR